VRNSRRRKSMIERGQEGKENDSFTHGIFEYLVGRGKRSHARPEDGKAGTLGLSAKSNRERKVYSQTQRVRRGDRGHSPSVEKINKRTSASNDRASRPRGKRWKGSAQDSTCGRNSKSDLKRSPGEMACLFRRQRGNSAHRCGTRS